MQGVAPRVGGRQIIDRIRDPTEAKRKNSWFR
jgi:hypothetical protein